jgi:hypothetical protein
MPTIPKPRPEYDVIWNGAHRHCDADLLTAAAIPEKPTPSPRRDGTAVVSDALPTRDAAGLTLKELVGKTQLTPAAVHNALYKLRAWGRLQTSTDRSYRAPQRYWRKTDAIAPEAIGGEAPADGRRP